MPPRLTTGGAVSMQRPGKRSTTSQLNRTKRSSNRCLGRGRHGHSYPLLIEARKRFMTG